MEQRYQTGQLYDVPLAQICTNPDQPRKNFDPEALAALQHSLKQHGLLNPVTLIPGEDGKLYLAAGERRLRAARGLGWASIPARIVEGDLEDLALMENMIREDLNPMERALSMQRYLDTHMVRNAKGRRVKCKQNDLAKILGMAKNSVSEILSLNRLPEDIQAVVLHDRRYPLNKLRVIARTRDSAAQQEKFRLLRQTIEGETKQPATPATAQAFDSEKTAQRLARMTAELRTLRKGHSKQDLKRIKPTLTALYDELQAMLYKVSDDISLREYDKR